MRFFALGVGLLCAAGASAAPRYHAVNLGPVAGYTSGKNTTVCGIGSDGAIAYFDRGSLSPQTTGIYHNGQFRSLQSITGYDFFYPFKIKTASDWFIPSHNYFRFGDEFTSGSGSQFLPWVQGGGMSAAKGDFSFFRYEHLNFDNCRSAAFVTRNGTLLEIDRAISTNQAHFTVDMNESGWIVGGTSNNSPWDSVYKPWILAPGSLTPTLIPASTFMTSVLKISEDGYVYGRRGDRAARWTIGANTSEYLLDPLGQRNSDSLDANNRGQAVMDALRTAGNGLPQRRSIALWENGASFYIEDSLDNPSDFMFGHSMRGLGINDKGQIATSLEVGGTRYLYRFDPVPEPGTLLALGAGFAAIAVRRMRR